MKIGILVKCKKRSGRVDRGLLIGIIVAVRKVYGNIVQVVLWNDGSIEMEDETTIEVLK